MSPPINAMTTTPPAAPPAIAAVFDDFLVDLPGVETTEEDEVGAPVLAVV